MVDLSELDIVYPIRRTRNGNEELRYSLRSVEKYLPHRKIYLYSSSAIEWVSPEVETILAQELTTGVNASVNSKLLKACQNAKISDPFILMNDDFFALKPIEELPYYTTGSLMDEINARRSYDRFRMFLDSTRDKIERDYLVKNPLNFEIHLPMVMDKQTLRQVLLKYPTSIRRSLYVYEWLKHHDELNTKFLDHDCKLYMFAEWPYPGVEMMSLKDIESSGSPWVSTSDQYWSAFRQVAIRIFEKKSKYER